MKLTKQDEEPKDLIPRLFAAVNPTLLEIDKLIDQKGPVRLGAKIRGAVNKIFPTPETLQLPDRSVPLKSPSYLPFIFGLIIGQKLAKGMEWEIDLKSDPMERII